MGGGSQSYGLRRHHAASGVAVCATCHAGEPVPAGENTVPRNYGGALTRANFPCNPGPAYDEDWSGNNRGLDNDGDTLYDTADPDCLSCPDADGDTYSPAGGGCGAIDCNDAAASVYPGATETCNNVDDDCDGLTDETLTRACSTACGSGTETCAAGVWGGCTAPTPQPEVCNNVDDDCDGSTDEGLTRTCTTICGSGTETCSAGLWVGCTARTPTPETCNAVDDDCDGSTDEGLTRACSTACGSGTETCAAGFWVGCTAPTPQPETCDNLDNDCDGRRTELTRACATAQLGNRTCAAGFWVGCTAPTQRRGLRQRGQRLRRPPMV